MKENRTAFPETESGLKNIIKSVETGSFIKTRIPTCSIHFKECFGRCCSLKVAVTSEEERVLVKICKEKTHFFKKIGLTLPKKLTVIDREIGRRRLAQKRRGFFEINRIIYSFMAEKKKRFAFNAKSFLGLLRKCVFSLRDGRCALQILSEAEKRHKWYYKPINCWKYPMTFAAGKVGVENEGSFYFSCDAGDRNAPPAYIGLREEIEFLGNIIGKNILDELQSTHKTLPDKD